MPSDECTLASLDTMATGEGVEAVSGVTWSVLQEDVMLCFCREVRHVVVENEGDEAVAVKFWVDGALQKSPTKIRINTP